MIDRRRIATFGGGHMVKCGLACALLVVLCGCPPTPPGPTGLDGGMDGSVPDMTMTGDGPMQPDMAGPPVDCNAVATSICTNMQMCTPNLFTLAYESATICKSVVAAQCTANVAAGDNGVVDAVACQAALSASCTAYFAAQLDTPAPCKRKLGSVPDQGACKFSSQCTAGEYCYKASSSSIPPPACPGVCQMAVAANQSCTIDSDCDTDNGARCVDTFMTGTPPTSDGFKICQPITRGAQGAACVAGSNTQCANGLGCDGNHTCQTLLAATASCDGANSTLCDARKGDTCQPDPQNPGAHVCTPIHVVMIGAQCGTFGSPPTMQLCSAYAICSGAGTMMCAARVMLNQPCTASPDNCYPGLVCTAGTCQTAPGPTC
jgi:hypothetical protein